MGCVDGWLQAVPNKTTPSCPRSQPLIYQLTAADMETSTSKRNSARAPLLNVHMYRWGGTGLLEQRPVAQNAHEFMGACAQEGVSQTSALHRPKMPGCAPSFSLCDTRTSMEGFSMVRPAAWR